MCREIKATAEDYKMSSRLSSDGPTKRSLGLNQRRVQKYQRQMPSDELSTGLQTGPGGVLTQILYVDVPAGLREFAIRYT